MKKGVPASMRTHAALSSPIEGRLSSLDGRSELVQLAKWRSGLALSQADGTANRRSSSSSVSRGAWPAPRSARCAAASRATGTRKGEQET